MALFKTKPGPDRRRADANDPAGLLIIDHQKVEKLFEQITEAQEPNMRKGLVAQLEAELTRHTTIEEEVLYPFIRECVPGGPDMVEEAQHEHEEAKQTLARVAVLDPSSAAFKKELAALEGQISHHVKEEENEVFPKLGEATPPSRLAKLRGELERARVAAAPKPTLPKGTATRRTRGARPSTRPSSGRRPAVWVQPHHTHDGRWQVRREDASRASRVFDRQAEAEQFGRRVARRERVEFILTRADGSIRTKDSYGNDPRNVRG